MIPPQESVDAMTRALQKVWKGLHWEHFTESQHLTDAELAVAIIASLEAEGWFLHEPFWPVP